MTNKLLDKMNSVTEQTVAEIGVTADAAVSRTSNALSQLPPEFDYAGKCAMREKAAATKPEHHAFGHMSDEWVADRVRMLMRGDLWHEAICTAGRDRIMKLSLEVERLQALLKLETAALEQACAAPVDAPLTVEQARSTPEPCEGLDTPWPLRDVLAKLIDATEHLLDDHNCDTHGHEEYRAAVNAGKALQGRRASQPPAVDDVHRRVAELYDAALCSITFNLNEPVSAKEAQRALDAAKEIK